MNEAFDEQLAFQRALREFVGGVDSAYAKEHEEFFIGLEGSFGAKHVTPRTLTSRFIGNLVCVEGIVTKCNKFQVNWYTRYVIDHSFLFAGSLVRPKIVRSVHYCPATKKSIERRYTDLTSFDAFPSSAVYPTKVMHWLKSYHLFKIEIDKTFFLSFKDEDGNLLETEYGLSSYKDHQTITIQEMPEKAPAGQFILKLLTSTT